jgi:hypothetical protein
MRCDLRINATAVWGNFRVDNANLHSSTGALTNLNPATTIDTSPRGIKRSRSPDNTYGDLPTGDGDDGALVTDPAIAVSLPSMRVWQS